MWLPIIGLMFGVLIGLLTNLHIPDQYSIYLAVVVLAALDTLFGGIRAYLQNEFDSKVFVAGFLFNLFLAAGLAFLGAQLGVDLYLAAVFALGFRMFRHFSDIRKILMGEWAARRNKEN